MPRVNASIKESEGLRAKILELQEQPFFDLFYALQNHMISLLPNYVGKNEVGYQNEHVYAASLRKLLPAEVIADDKLFVRDNDKVVDVNWPQIKQALYRITIEQGYLDLTKNEGTFLMSLSFSDISITREHLEANIEAFRTFFPSIKELDSFLKYHQEIPNAKKVKLIQFFATVNDATFNQEFIQLSSLQHNESLRNDFYKTIEGGKVLSYLKNQFLPNPFTGTTVIKIAKILKLLGFLRLLSRDEQIQILQASRATREGTALLDIIWYSSSETVSVLLDFITEFKLEDPCLLAIDKNNQDVLMNTVWIKPELVSKILTMLKTLNPEQQADILERKNSDGTTSLDHALSAQKEQVDPILQALEALPLAAQCEILKIPCVGLNPLMRAISLKLTPACDKLLNSIAEFHLAEQQSIFLQTSSLGNILSLAQEHMPALVDKLIQQILTFDIPTQKAIFAVKGNNSKTAFENLTTEQKMTVLTSMMHWETTDQEEVTHLPSILYFIANNHPDHFHKFLEVLKSLPLDKQKEILNAKLAAGNTAVQDIIINASAVTASELLDVISELKLEDPCLLATTGSNNQDLLLVTLWKKPKLVSKVLAMLKDLNPEQQADIFKRKNTLGTTSLDYALYYQIAQVDPILQAIAALPLAAQCEIFKIQRGGINPLMMTIFQQVPAACDKMLNSIAALPVSEQQTIFLQTSPLRNILSLAQENMPALVDKLIQQILTFDIPTQKAIFTIKDKNSKTAFENLTAEQKMTVLLSMMHWETTDQEEVTHLPSILSFIAINHPDHFHEFLGVLKSLPLEKQKEILNTMLATGRAVVHNIIISASAATASALLDVISELNLEAPCLLATDNTNQDLLLLTVWKKPELVSKVFTMLKTLKPEQQADILERKNTSGITPLLYALAFKIAQVDPILQAIAALPLAAQCEIFKIQCSGFNPLMMAIFQQVPAACDKMLNSIAALPVSEQQTIFLQTSQLRNILSLAQEFMPNLVDTLIKQILTFDIPTQKAIFTIKDKNLKTAFDNLTTKQRITVLRSMIDWDKNEQKDLLDKLQLSSKPISYLKPLVHTLLKLQDSETIATLFSRIDLSALPDFLGVTDEKGDTLLMATLERFPGLGHELSERVKKAKLNIVTNLLNMQSNKGTNALMSAAKYSPQTVTWMLDVAEIAKDKNYKKNMLLQRSDSGFNALMIASVDVIIELKDGFLGQKAKGLRLALYDDGALVVKGE